MGEHGHRHTGRHFTGGAEKFALKITICPKNKQYALKLTFFSLIRIGPETPCKAVLYN